MGVGVLLICLGWLMIHRAELAPRLREPLTLPVVGTGRRRGVVDTEQPASDGVDPDRDRHRGRRRGLPGAGRPAHDRPDVRRPPDRHPRRERRGAGAVPAARALRRAGQPREGRHRRPQVGLLPLQQLRPLPGPVHSSPSSRWRRRPRGGPDSRSYALGVVLGIELLETETRGAWIAALVGIIVVGAVLDRRLLLGALVVPLLLVAFVPSVSERVTSTLPDPGEARTESSLTWRFEHWVEVLPMVQESPVTGVGLDETQRRTGKQPHNDFLLVLVEMGVVGIARLPLVPAVPPILTGFRATKRVIDPRLPVEPLVHGVTVALFGYAVAFIVASIGREPARERHDALGRAPCPRRGLLGRPRAAAGADARPTYAGRAPRAALPAMGLVVSGGSTLLAPRHGERSHLVRRAGYRLRPGPRELPRYFIVGAKRAGTTSLDEYINAHPLVLRGLVEKGCRYYDVNFSRGPDWFRKQLLPVATVDRLERKLGQRPIVGESSPYYAYLPDGRRTDRGRRAGRAADLPPSGPGRAGLVALPLRGGPRLRDSRLRRRVRRGSGTPGRARRPKPAAPPPPLQLRRPEPVRRAAGAAAGVTSTPSRSW